MKLPAKNTGITALCAMALLAVVPSTAQTSSTEESSTPDSSARNSGGQGFTIEENEEAAASLAPCSYNTYMCCWTEFDGPGGMHDNTDVCRVMDYPNEGDIHFLPSDEEGQVYCHGFAWENDADLEAYLVPLYHYVTNVNSTEEGGYSGNVIGAPQCGCIEDMPVVSDAACTRYDRAGLVPCYRNSLSFQYSHSLDEPKGPIDFNLVRKCDNADVPYYDYRSCEYNTYMCCWTENSNNAMSDNTDVCRVLDYPAIGETVEYPGDTEGDVHCHGFVWPEDADDNYIHLAAQHVQNFDHRNNRGYHGNVEGAPMCGCVEEMPQVTEADCSAPNEEGGYSACTRNDLRTRYLEEYPQGDMPNLVETCDNGVAE